MAIKAPCPHCEPGNLGSLHCEKPGGVLETDWVSLGDCVTVNLFLHPRAVPMLVGPHQRMDLLFYQGRSGQVLACSLSRW